MTTTKLISQVHTTGLPRWGRSDLTFKPPAEIDTIPVYTFKYISDIQRVSDVRSLINMSYTIHVPSDVLRAAHVFEVEVWSIGYTARNYLCTYVMKDTELNHRYGVRPISAWAVMTDHLKNIIKLTRV